MSECDVSRVSEYWRRKAVYMSEPYACAPPVYESADIEEGLIAQQTSNGAAWLYKDGLMNVTLLTSMAVVIWTSVCERLR